MELGDVNEDGVDVSKHVYFQQGRIALRLEGPKDIVVVALSRDAAAKLARLLTENG